MCICYVCVCVCLRTHTHIHANIYVHIYKFKLVQMYISFCTAHCEQIMMQIIVRFDVHHVYPCYCNNVYNQSFLLDFLNAVRHSFKPPMYICKYSTQTRAVPSILSYSFVLHVARFTIELF